MARRGPRAPLKFQKNNAKNVKVFPQSSVFIIEEIFALFTQREDTPCREGSIYQEPA